MYNVRQGVVKRGGAGLSFGNSTREPYSHNSHKYPPMNFNPSADSQIKDSHIESSQLSAANLTTPISSLSQRLAAGSSVIVECPNCRIIFIKDTSKDTDTTTERSEVVVGAKRSADSSKLCSNCGGSKANETRQIYKTDNL